MEKSWPSQHQAEEFSHLDFRKLTKGLALAPWPVLVRQGSLRFLMARSYTRFCRTATLLLNWISILLSLQTFLLSCTVSRYTFAPFSCTEMERLTSGWPFQSTIQYWMNPFRVRSSSAMKHTASTLSRSLVTSLPRSIMNRSTFTYFSLNPGEYVFSSFIQNGKNRCYCLSSLSSFSNFSTVFQGNNLGISAGNFLTGSSFGIWDTTRSQSYLRAESIFLSLLSISSLLSLRAFSALLYLGMRRMSSNDLFTCLRPLTSSTFSTSVLALMTSDLNLVMARIISSALSSSPQQKCLLSFQRVAFLMISRRRPQFSNNCCTDYMTNWLYSWKFSLSLSFTGSITKEPKESTVSSLRLGTSLMQIPQSVLFSQSTQSVEGRPHPQRSWQLVANWDCSSLSRASRRSTQPPSPDQSAFCAGPTTSIKDRGQYQMWLIVSLWPMSRSLTIFLNSSQDILPSQSSSALMMVRSTSCCSWLSVRLSPTIIFREVNSSPFEMKPSWSMSQILKANWILASSSVPQREASPVRNSLNDILPSLLMSKMSITRLTSGLCANSGTSKIQLGSSSPLPSVSISLNRLYSFFISSFVKVFSNYSVLMFPINYAVSHPYNRNRQAGLSTVRATTLARAKTPALPLS